VLVEGQGLGRVRLGLAPGEPLCSLVVRPAGQLYGVREIDGSNVERTQGRHHPKVDHILVTLHVVPQALLHRER
jgi:hypothetical protein